MISIEEVWTVATPIRCDGDGLTFLLHPPFSIPTPIPKTRICLASSLTRQVDLNRSKMHVINHRRWRWRKHYHYRIRYNEPVLNHVAIIPMKLRSWDVFIRCRFEFIRCIEFRRAMGISKGLYDVMNGMIDDALYAMLRYVYVHEAKGWPVPSFRMSSCKPRAMRSIACRHASPNKKKMLLSLLWKW